ncbi:hypothetical protein BpHYR1_048038 [Brachionus plicatilis]|uniref:Uncharacterized protein n=1 Tax=Brachionus plicatilis TaxID=10195 RepID=A0A3M7T9J1_BRAPC|nr:hypothetical protein BpHYR1_048038 [Brachionus plicatilis]
MSLKLSLILLLLDQILGAGIFVEIKTNKFAAHCAIPDIFGLFIQHNRVPATSQIVINTG